MPYMAFNAMKTRIYGVLPQMAPVGAVWGGIGSPYHAVGGPTGPIGDRLTVHGTHGSNMAQYGLLWALWVVLAVFDALCQIG